MEWLWTIFLSLVGFFAFFALLFTLPFIATMRTGSDTMERDKSLLVWIIAAAVLIGGTLSFFKLGDFKEIVSWIVLGSIFLYFISFFFSKEKNETPNGAVPWDPYWVPKFDNSKDKKIEVTQDKKSDE